MSQRFPPAKPPPKEDPKPNKDGNALWRIPTWFPELDAETMGMFKTFQSDLLKFNAKVNLISRNTERDSDEAHFADCILGAKLLLKVDLGTRVYDIGSGNGFPGLILAIMDPRREYFLVESDTRKCEFMKYMADRLTLKNVQVMNVRIETLLDDNVKVAVSRGFAPIGKAVLVCNRAFSKGGRYYHLKGSNWSTEIAGLPSQLISVWKPDLLGEYALPVSQVRRYVVTTQKIA